MPHLEDDPLWYKDAIIYQLHVKAFMDSDGDGIGDFKGLSQKLDYLQEPGGDGDLAAAVLPLPAHATTGMTFPTTAASTRLTATSGFQEPSCATPTSAVCG